MKFFLDTANIEEIRKGVSLGLVDGVTTNPSLVAKEGKSLEDVAKEICDLVDGPVSLEVVSTESKDIIEEARRLAKVHENAVVKIPMIEEGLKALKVVSQEGIRVNVTLVFSPTQALLARQGAARFPNNVEAAFSIQSDTPCQIIVTTNKDSWHAWNTTTRNNMFAPLHTYQHPHTWGCPL